MIWKCLTSSTANHELPSQSESPLLTLCVSIQRIPENGCDFGKENIAVVEAFRQA